MNENSEITENQSRKRDNTKNIIIIVLSAVVLCLIAAVVVLSVMLAKKSEEKEPSATDQYYSAVLTAAAEKGSEKSKKASDVSIISDCMAAAEKVAIDPQFDLSAGSEFVLYITDGRVMFYQKDRNALNEWKLIVGESYSLRASDFKEISGKIVGTLQDTGSVSWSSQGIEPILEFSPDFKKKWF